MENMHEILNELARTNERSVLATIIQVEGSAYRKEGATMLFTESGKDFGIISAGCLEQDLAIQANNLLHDKEKYRKKVVYDMSSEDGLSWGRGAGCNGVIHILLEKVTEQMKNDLLTLHQHLKDGSPVISFRLLNNDSVFQPFFISKSGEEFGFHFENKHTILQSFPLVTKSGTIFSEQLNEYLYVQLYFPRPRLFIFGAGPDVHPLKTIAEQSGFSVFIWDWRPANLQTIPETYTLKGPIPKVINEIQLKETDSVIIMTHDFQQDQQLLQLLLKHDKFTYLGVLGPRHRTKRLLKSEHIPNQLYSPIGLPIGSKGPAEIAISIVAQLIQVQRQKLNKSWNMTRKNAKLA